jgi:molybdenum cofactor synthesis domain-containing protein
MIEISKALKIIKRETKSLGDESVRLSDAVGRILAEHILADTDMPPFDRSQMDGFAVRAKDTENAPVELKIVGESAAGRGWHRKMKSGEAVRIMTGAPVPDGADAIQKIELTSEGDGIITILEPTETGKYIVKRAAEIKKRGKLFGPGDAINDKMIATLAAFGYAKVRVFSKPNISILGTGSEIVAIDKTPGRDQIRNSNSTMLKALCESAGGRARILPQTGDDLEKLKRVISKAVGLGQKSAARNPQFEILVMTGGVSVGKYDLTKAALHELGAEIFFERVRLRPGKPAVFARLNETLIFGLPGNPVSAAVTFYLFVRTAILKMQSASQTDLRSGFAVLASTAKATKERDTYLPATLDPDASGHLVATPLRWHGSSDFVGFAKADALVFIARGETISAGAVGRIVYL